MALNFNALLSRTNAGALAAFGQQVTLNGVSVQADFFNGYALGDVGLSGMATVAPVLVLQTSAVPASPVGMTVVADGTSYLVAMHEPDGYGLSRLVLELAA